MKLLPTKIKPVPASHVDRLVKKLRAEGVSLSKLTEVLRALLVERKAVTKLSTRRGRARGRGQSSKAKGRSAVNLTRSMLLQYISMAVGLEDDDVFVKATSQGGCDIHLSPLAQEHFPFAIEIKNVEKLNIWAALAQAQANAQKQGYPAIVFFKRAHTPLFVALEADKFLGTLYGESR